MKFKSNNSSQQGTHKIQFNDHHSKSLTCYCIVSYHTAPYPGIFVDLSGAHAHTRLRTCTHTGLTSTLINLSCQLT